MGDYQEKTTPFKSHTRNKTPLIQTIKEIPGGGYMGSARKSDVSIEHSPRGMETSRSPDQSPSKTAPHAKRSSSVPRKISAIKYGLSVSDTVKLGSKKNSQMGIPGYDLKLWHHDVNKPIIYGIHKELKPRHYLDDILRQKKMVPPPDTYNVRKDLTVKMNVMNQKSARLTVASEIERNEKKKKFPEPASYKLQHNQVETRTLGCFDFKSDRSGYLEEAAVIGKEQAPYCNKNYSSVDPKLKHPHIWKPVPEKPKEKSSLSPTSYKPDESYRNTQIKKPKVYISKYKYENYMNTEIKNKKWVPGPGTHNFNPKGEMFLTKGSAKGWK